MESSKEKTFLKEEKLFLGGNGEKFLFEPVETEVFVVRVCGWGVVADTSRPVVKAGEKWSYGWFCSKVGNHHGDGFCDCADGLIVLVGLKVVIVAICFVLDGIFPALMITLAASLS